MHRTILVVDVERFGDPTRNDRDRVVVRRGLYAALKRAFDDIGATWDHHEDRGDGVLILVHPQIPKSVLVDEFPDFLIRALDSHNKEHPTPQGIRLRVALHAGEVTFDDTGVVATAVNVAFRLLDSDELRQALKCTPSAAALIVSSWFFDEVVRHSLTNATYRPVRITAKETSTVGWIRTSDGVDVSIPAGLNQLPAKPTHFCGREAELAELWRGMVGADRQLFVITGPGGIGKTSLAVEWLHQSNHQFPGGVLYADLSRNALPNEVLGRLMSSLAVSPPRGQPERAAVFSAMTRQKPPAMLLDNAGSAAQVRQLLPTTGLVVVTTRRQLSGLVADGAKFVQLKPLDQVSGVQMLAVAVGRERVLSEVAHAEALARLCAGLPLALAVVAAQLVAHPHRTLQAQESLLKDTRTRLARLSIQDDLSVRTVIDMSYQALSPETARLYLLLGLHLRPEFPLGVAAAAAGRSDDEAVELIDTLLDANLLEEVGEHRFRMPELMHLYAREQAEAELSAEERAIASEIMTEWYLRRARAADQMVRTDHRHLSYEFVHAVDRPASFTDHDEALTWLDVELPNILSEARRAIDAGQPELSWQLCDALWALRYRVDQRTSILICRIGMRAAGIWGHDLARARACFRLGLVEMDAGNLIQAREHMTVALRIRQRIGDQRGATNVREGIGLLVLRSDPAEAVRILSEVLEQKRSQGGPRRLGRALLNLGRAVLADGDPTRAIQYLSEAEVQFSTMPEADNYDNAPLEVLFGQAYQALGQHSLAVARVRGSLERANHLQTYLTQAEAHEALGSLAEEAHDWRAALVEYRQSANILEKWSTTEAARITSHIGIVGKGSQPWHRPTLKTPPREEPGN